MLVLLIIVRRRRKMRKRLSRLNTLKPELRGAAKQISKALRNAKVVNAWMRACVRACVRAWVRVDRQRKHELVNETTQPER